MKSILSKYDPFTKLVNLFDAASRGDASAKVQRNYLVQEASKDIAVGALDATATIAGTTSDVAGKVALGGVATGQPEIAVPAGAISTVASGIEVAALSGKATLTGNSKDVAKATGVARQFSIGLIIGRLTGGFLKTNPMKQNSVTPEVREFAATITPEVYSAIDKYLSQ